MRDSRAGAELRRQREQIAAFHGRPVPSDRLGELLQVERVGRDSRHRARGRARASAGGVPGQAQRLAQPQRHVQAVRQLLEGRRELGGVHTPLVVAQGALSDSGPGGDLALGDLAVVQDGDDRAGVAPLARLIEVLTCENGGQLLAEDMLWFGHGARPFPWVALRGEQAMRLVNHTLL